MRKSLAMFLTIAMLMNLAFTVSFTVSAAETIASEFSVDGNTLTTRDRWTANGAMPGSTVLGGFFNATASGSATSSTFFFSKALTTPQFSTADYNVIEVGMKYTNIAAGSVPAMYFSSETTVPTEAQVASQSVYADPLSKTSTVGDEVVTVRFHMASHLNWASVESIRALRFYPFTPIAGTSTISIDYIRIMDFPSYTLTYDKNAGSDPVLNIPASIPVLSGDEVALDNVLVPTRAYFTFRGWSATPGGTQAVTSVGPVTQNTTVYAIWEEKVADTAWEFTTGGEGWIVEDWSLAQDGAQSSVSNGIYSITALPNKDVQFLSPDALGVNADEYTIMKIGMAHKNAGYSAKEAPKIQLKTAAGWLPENSALSSTPFAGPSSANMVEYVIDLSEMPGWTGRIDQIKMPIEAAGTFDIDYVRLFKQSDTDPNHKLYFDIGSQALGIDPYAISAPAGTSIALPADYDFYRPGYSFRGWSIDPNGSPNDVLTSFLMPEYGATLYAVWEARTISPLTVTNVFPANGAEEIDPRNVVVTYEFSADVRSATITVENFSETYFEKAVYNEASRTASLYFKPDFVLFGSTVSFTPSASILSAEGASLSAVPYTISFAESSKPDGYSLITNGDAGDPNHLAFIGDANSTVTLVPEPGDLYNYAHKAEANRTGRFGTYIKQNVRFIPGKTYEVEWRAKLVGTNTGQIMGLDTGMSLNLLYNDPNQPSVDHVKSVRNANSNMWTYMSTRMTISRDSTNRESDQIAFLASGGNVGGVDCSFNYLIDDITMRLVPTVDFIGGWGAVGSPPTDFDGREFDQVYPETIILPENTFTKEYSEFAGWSDGKAVYQPGSEYTVVGSPLFTAVWDSPYKEYTAKFDSNGATGPVPAEVTLIEIDPLTLPWPEFEKSGYVFQGWGTAKNSAVTVAPGTQVTLTGNVTYYAIWAPVSSWEFNNDGNFEGWDPNTSGTIDDARVSDGFLSGTARNRTSNPDNPYDPQMTKDGLLINAAEYSKIVVGMKYSNVVLGTKSNIMFWHASNVASYSPNGTVTAEYNLKSSTGGKVEELVFNMGGHAQWKGVIGKLRFDPVHSKGEFHIDYIRFVRNHVLEDTITLTLTAPELRKSPQLLASAPYSALYRVTGTTWSPALIDNRFAPDTTYTASVVVTPKTGFLFGPETTAVMNGSPKNVIFNSDGTATVKYTYPKTAPLQNISVELSAPSASITTSGGQMQITAKINTPQPIDDTSVVWTIDNAYAAAINADGVLRAINDGIVRITATSVYDPTKSDTIKITISGQSLPYSLTYDANAGADNDLVGNLPPVDHTAKGNAHPLTKDYPVREGFVCVGWSVDPLGAEGLITTLPITGNRTVYAIWAEAISWEFPDSLSLADWSFNSSHTPRIENGALVSEVIGSDPVMNLNAVPATLIGTAELSKYSTMEIAMAHDLQGISRDFQIFFATEHTTPEGLSEGNSVKMPVSGTSSNGQFIIYRHSFADNTSWRGKLRQLRFDFIDGTLGTVKVDYIRFYKNKVDLEFNANTTDLDLVSNMPANGAYNAGLIQTTGYGTPTRVGYRFLGWGLSADAQTPVTKMYLGEDTTLFALWEPQWLFEGADDTLGWVSDANTENFRVESNRLKGDYNHEDMEPQILSPDIQSGSTSLNLIKFTMKHVITTLPEGVSACDAKIYYQTGADTEFTEDKSIVIPNIGMTSAGKLIDHVVDITGKPGWGEEITKLRIVPFHGQGSYEIWKVSLESGTISKPVVSSPVSTSKNFLFLFTTFDQLANGGDTSSSAGKGSDIAWNFNTDGKNEGWSGVNLAGGIVIKDGKLKGEAQLKENGSYDPIIGSPEINIDTSKYKYVVVNMKWDILTLSGNAAQMFFSGESQPVAEEASLKVEIKQKSDGFVNLVFDFSEHELWKGTMNKLRLDPFNTGGTFEIDYILVTETKPDEAASSAGSSTETKPDPKPDPKPAAPDTPATSGDTAWEFNKNGDKEGWTLAGAAGDVKGGTLSATATPRVGEVAEKFGVYDPYLTSPELSVNTSEYKYVVFSMKHELLDAGNGDIKVYYKTTDDPAYSEENTVRKDIPGSSNGAFVEYTLDMSAKSNWSGLLTGLRIDAINTGGSFEIDYIRLLKDAPEEKPAETKPDDKPINDGPFAPVRKYDGNTFADVPANAWYYADVSTAYQLELMNGKGEGVFDPDGQVTVAEAIALAVRMNDIYHGGDASFTQGTPWYQVYVDQAIEAGIIRANQYDDYGQPIKRGEMAEIFAKALPGDYYNAINQFKSIPDVSAGDSYSEAVLLLYNAGIVVGADAQFNYLPDNDIKRCEVAAIINRIAVKDNRIRKMSPEEQAEIDAAEIAEKEKAEKEAAEKAARAKETAILFDFKDGNMGDFETGHCVAKIENGVLTATSVISENGIFDPIVYIPAGPINLDDYRVIRVGLKWDFKNDVSGMYPSVFFTTTADDKWTAEKNVMASRSLGAGKSDEFVEFVMTCSTNSAWTGTLKQLRFDPADGDGTFEIEYIQIEEA